MSEDTIDQRKSPLKVDEQPSFSHQYFCIDVDVHLAKILVHRGSVFEWVAMEDVHGDVQEGLTGFTVCQGLKVTAAQPHLRKFQCFVRLPAALTVTWVDFVDKTLAVCRDRERKKQQLNHPIRVLLSLRFCKIGAVNNGAKSIIQSFSVISLTIARQLRPTPTLANGNT